MLHRTAAVSTWRYHVNTGAELQSNARGAATELTFSGVQEKRKNDARVLFISLLSCNLLPYTAECNKQLSSTSCCLHISWKTAVDTTLLYKPGSRTNVQVKDEEAYSKYVIRQSQQTGTI